MPEILETLEEHTIQKPTKVDGGMGFMMWAMPSTGLLPPWWSKMRDKKLREFWKKVDYLSGAINAYLAKLTTIPIQIEPRDMTLKTHVKLADKFNMMLDRDAEFVQSWITFYGKFLLDQTTQDNGSFGEVIGEGPPDGPIRGMPLGLAQLDSLRCTRTGDPEFPVRYAHTDGKLYKLHYTRVIFTSQMPSPAKEMLNVGFSAVSRCSNIAQSMLDVITYKQEKLGSRPIRGLAITRGGLDPDTVRDSLRLAESRMNAMGLKRFSKIVITGASTAPEAGIDFIDFANLPDGFDEKSATVIGMAAIALALGMDPRDLWPAMETGTTKAEAALQHMKQRGKTLGQTLKMTENLLNYKFLPPTLKATFDYQDDAQDAQRAEIRSVRSTRRSSDLTNATTDARVEREQMLHDNDLTKEQFVHLELQDGRLEDGIDVLTLFFDPEYAELLGTEIGPKLDDAENAEDLIISVNTKRLELLARYPGAHPRDQKRFDNAMAALNRVLYLSKPKPEVEEVEEEEDIGEESPDDELDVSDGEIQEADETIKALRVWETKAMDQFASRGTASVRYRNKAIPKAMTSLIAKRLKKAYTKDSVNRLFDFVIDRIKAVRIIPSGADEKPAAVDRASKVTEEDIERAVAKWDDWMEGFEGILDAVI